MRWFFLVALLTITPTLTNAQNGRGFQDEFNGTQLDASIWSVLNLPPTVSDGKLVLSGNATMRSEVQSKQNFSYGVLTVAIESSNWHAQSDPADADASFGVEIFTGANGRCHYSAILKADGHLGLLRPQPDTGNNCTGDPPTTGQEHIRLSNWDAIRTGGKVVMILIWTPGGVTLRISDGNTLNGIAVSMANSQAVPNVQMKIRLNADTNETYRVDYVRWAELPPTIKSGEFVKTANSKLMIGNTPFRVAGANTYYLQPEIVYGNADGAREALDKMLAMGLTVARTIGFNDHAYKNGDGRCGNLTSEIAGDDPATIQLRPGVFCEPNLVALDQAIAEAKARNIRLIVYLTNNFTAYGGKRRYVQWRLGAGSNPTEEQLGMFYTDATIKQWFKDYLTMLLTRRNTVTGALYKEEPAILAWELGNELRNSTSVVADRARRANELLAWQREMAGFLKSLDTNHLVADGGEGFDDNEMNYPGLSNTYSVRGDESCSFSRLVNEPAIDLLSYHLYPQNWGLNDNQDVEIWIRAHEQLARAAGKVAYLGEFGYRISGTTRDATRAPIFDRWLPWSVEDYCSAGQIVWQLAYDTRPDSDNFSVYFPRDVLTIELLWSYASSTAAPPLAAVNAASYSGVMLAPDSISGLFGSAMALTVQVASGLPLPTTLAGSQVTVRDSAGTERAAPLFFVSPTQINFVVPSGTANGVATIKAVLNNGFVACGLAMVNSVAPGLFTADASGSGLPAGYVLRVKSGGAQMEESLVSPIDLGAAGDQVYLILYGTGIRYRSNLTNVIVTIGGTPVSVLYAGEAPGYVGLDQINVGPLPRSLAGRGMADVAVTVDGKFANTVKVVIK